MDRHAQIDMLVEQIAEVVRKTPGLSSYKVTIPSALTPDQQEIAREAGATAAMRLCVPIIILVPDLDAMGKEGTGE